MRALAKSPGLVNKTVAPLACVVVFPHQAVLRHLGAGALCWALGTLAYAQPVQIPHDYTLAGSARLVSAPEPAQGMAGLQGQVPGIAGVVDLSRAWRLALEYDHTYRAAISEQAAAQTERAQGRAGLLPQIQAAYSRSRISGNRVDYNARGQSNSSELKYDSSNAYIQLQQPLLNYGRYAAYQRGVARAGQGVAVFAVKQQETGIRLAMAYLNALLAYDNLALQRSLADSLQERAHTLEALFKHDANTKIEVQETQARLAVARADVIAAADQLRVAARELESLLGGPVAQLAALQPTFPLQPLEPASLANWLERARANNAEVRAKREAVRVAETEVDQAASRYFPTVDLVVNYGKADSENLSTLSQRTNTFMIGIQANIPIFTGGYNTANVSRTRSERKRLQHELDATLERTQAEVVRQYTNVQGGAERIKALQAGVDSGQLALDAANKSFLVGAFSNLDVLRAQDNLYQARYSLISARLEYLLARLTLASAAGVLDSSQFDAVSQAYLGRVITLDDSQPGR